MTYTIELFDAERNEIHNIYNGGKIENGDLLNIFKNLKFIRGDELTLKGKRWIKDNSKSLFGNYSRGKKTTYYFSNVYINSNT